MRLSRAFSLIELIVVIAIMGVVVSIVLPALSSAKSSAEKVGCLANLRSQGQGVVLYMDAGDGLLPFADLYMDARAGLIEPYASVAPFLDIGPPGVDSTSDVWVCPSDDDVFRDLGTSYLYAPYSVFAFTGHMADPRRWVTRFVMDDPGSVLFQDTFGYHARGSKMACFADGSAGPRD